MQLNYNHLYYFHVTATIGSIAAAATKLHVTQPTVSEQLRSLERTLGTTLFTRTSSGLKLTDAGRLAFEHTSVMFRAGERLVESLGQTTVDLPRTLRVGISSAISRSSSTDFLLPLLQLENCVPTIRTGDGVELIRAVAAAELDLALCETEPVKKSGLEITLVESTTLSLVAGPGVELANDWAEVGLIQYRPSSSYRWDVETYLSTQKVRPRIVCESDDALFQLEAAARGGYLAAVPRRMAREAIAQKRVREVAQIQPAHAGIHAVFQDGDTADLARNAVERLIAMAKEAS
jgi:LysR family transcriptional activator of nhaA